MTQKPTYGDYPYGTEPLSLPDPGRPWLKLGERESEFGDVPHRPALREDAHVSPTTRAWFRWITGHQVSFLIWRFIADSCELRHVASVDPRITAQLVDGYSASLVYTCAMSTDEYADSVRPAMERTHRAFSGSWAPDYRPIRTLMVSPRKATAALGAGGEEVVARIRECHDVHRQAADYLVPARVSLLQQSKRATGSTGAPEDNGFIFDSFFLVARRDISVVTALEQLERRVSVVTGDLERIKGQEAAEHGYAGLLAEVFGTAQQRIFAALASAAEIAAVRQEKVHF